MEKKSIQVHAFTVHMYTVAIIVLTCIVVVLGLKYVHLKLAVSRYTQSALWQQTQGSPTGNVNDYGVIIATTIQGQSLLAQPALQTYVSSVSKNIARDIVVLDRSKKILADSIVANKGATYVYDKGEISMTLADGKVRTFLEHSQDYPVDVEEAVVPIKDANNNIVGAVLISTSQMSK